MAGHDKMTAEGKRFFKQIEELKKLQVRIGYQKGQSKDDEGVDMLDIAVFNEIGTSRSPARPFIRQSADANKDKIEKFCKAELRKVAQGGTAEQTLNAVGVMQKGLIQDTITKSKEWAVPNADSTVNGFYYQYKRDGINAKTGETHKKGDKVLRFEGKGSDVPLIDSGKMLQSVNYAIVPKEGGGK